MSDFGNKQNSGALGTSSGAAAGTSQFPTGPIIPSGFEQYAGVSVPGLGSTASFPLAGRGLVTPGTVGSHSNTVSYPDARVAVDQPRTLGSELDHLLHEKDPKEILSIQRELIKAGYLNPHDSHGFIAGSVSSSDATYYAYAQAMTDAIQKGENYNKLISGLAKNPHNTLGQGYWSTFQQDQQMAKNGGASTVTSTDVSNTLTDATDARAVAQNVYQAELGRNINDHEAMAFTHALDAFEQANPNVTTSTQNYNAAGQGTGSNSQTVGGVNPDQFAQSYLMQNEPREYSKTQGEQIYNLFANLIGGSA